MDARSRLLRLVGISAMILVLVSFPIARSIATMRRMETPPFDVFRTHDPISVTDLPGGDRMIVYSLPIDFRACIDRIEPQLQSEGWVYDSLGNTYKLYEAGPVGKNSVWGSDGSGWITLTPDQATSGDDSTTVKPGWVTFRIQTRPRRIEFWTLIKGILGL